MKLKKGTKAQRHKGTKGEIAHKKNENSYTFKTKKIHLLILFISLSMLILFASARADEIQLFNQANDYYSEGNYGQAIEKYQALITEGYQDPPLFYNLGNAYFKIGELGRAILFYEKAKKILPRNEDILKNLQYVNSLTTDKIQGEISGFLSKLCAKIVFFLTINELTIIFTVIYLFLISTGIIYLFKKKETLRKILFQILAFSIVFFTITAMVSFYRIYHLKSTHRGVIVSDQVEIKSGPENSLATLFSLHEGATFKIQQKRGDWFQITLKNEWIGWVHSKEIEVI